MDASTRQEDAGSPQATETETLTPVPIYNFTLQEWAELYALRARYDQSRDLFSACELERLRFTKWLYETGRLEP
jgi:hypothetical protein